MIMGPLFSIDYHWVIIDRLVMKNGCPDCTACAIPRQQAKRWPCP